MAFAMVKMGMRKGRKRMKMTTKAMVKMSACPLQCSDISETKNGQDNSMNEEGANVRAEGKLRKH